MSASRRPPSDKDFVVGVISDTHGLVRPEALVIMQGCDHIIHAGDIGSEQVLKALEALAPLTAIRGNNDKQPWAKRIPETALIELGTHMIYVLHDLKQIDLDPRTADISVVISGHSHKPACVEKEGVLYLNPGSAGPRRFNLPLSAAKLYVTKTSVHAEIVPIELNASS